MDPLIRISKKYPLAEEKISGLLVGKRVDNTESISASLTNYTVLRGIRAIPLSSFQVTAPHELFYSKSDIERVARLANAILESKRIDPLIVVVDADGPYVLEGGHRLGALHALRKKKLPALVVVDEDNIQ